jgi:1-deoxy-D-xylulose-5-phosphate synthase
MTVLDQIREPADLRQLSRPKLNRLAREIRDFLITEVTRTGGHLGPNLGTVELTLALHRVFDSPRDRIVWDTGHQAYVHKIVTGRCDGFAKLKQAGGLSGYPCRNESEHDLVENSHASTSLSWADGLAKAYEVTGQRDRAVVAVVGDGALTGGMCWEALNNIAAAKDRPLVIVVNDNTRSYAPTIGGFADHLATLRTSRGYERFLEWGKHTVRSAPVVGDTVYGALHGAKKGLKDMIAPQGLFEDLGLKYVGPVDGHDVEAVETALVAARRFGGPVIVHCITEKGRGYAAAETHELDRLHAVGAAPVPGRPAATGRSWTSIFSEELVTIGSERSDVVAITASMLEPTGLSAFAKAYPDRVYDVGIAEQHAVTSSAGLSLGGLHPVVAIYATFLNRAFDQVLMDVALHRQAVTFVLDRAGVTGDDGPSHNGMWDLSILQVVPGLRIAAPRDGDRLRSLFRQAVAVEDGPTVVRYPKGPAPAAVPAVDTVGGLDVLRRSGSSDHPDILLVSVGAMASVCLGAAALLDEQEIGVTVVDPRWVKPLDPALAPLAARHRLVVTVEDSGRVGGVGSGVAQALRDAEVDTPVRNLGLPQCFLDHGKRADILASAGLTPSGVADRAMAALGRLDPARSEPALAERGAR